MAKGIRKFEIMQEVERININDLINWVDKLDCLALIVLHDKDAPRTPHYHAFVKLKNERQIKDVARFAGVETQYVQHIGSWKNALGYAFHFTEGAREDGKHIYDQDAIIFSKGVDFEEIRRLDENYRKEKDRNKNIIESIYKYGECEITKTKLMNMLTAADFHKHARLIKNMQEYRIIKVRDRDMKVIYLTGQSGSGKTTLAKYMAVAHNYDYFISGSGKDVLDGYDKEECIILDDLRGDAFTKAELFKLTDNNTNSSVKSRYKNKDISYCKLMIITSIKTPFELYNWKDESNETFEQFARRIGHSYASICDNGDIYYKYIDTNNNKITSVLANFNMNLVFAFLGINKGQSDKSLENLFRHVSQYIQEQNELKMIPDEELPF